MAWEWRGRGGAVWLAIGLLGVLGVRGLVGGGQFVLVPSGALVDVSTTVLTPTPFADFLVPGLFMVLAFGVAPLVAVYGLYDDRQWAPSATIAVGFVLVGWAIVEGFVLGFGERLQYLNLLHGIVLVAVAAIPSLRSRSDA